MLVRVGKGRGGEEGKKWVGVVRRQSLYIAFCGLKVWLLGKLERARMNVLALSFWKERLCRRAFVEWKRAKAERLFEEVNNEVALDFWYRTTVEKVWRGWLERAAYFLDIREEAERGARRAGFERFVSGAEEAKLWRLQRSAAKKMAWVRLEKFTKAVWEAWYDWVLFERKDREIRRQRRERENLQGVMFVRWRMWVRGIKLTRLVHIHHDKRFNESLEQEVLSEMAR